MTLPAPFRRSLGVALGIAAVTVGSPYLASPVQAQTDTTSDAYWSTWHDAWNSPSGDYDHNHILVGTVASFSDYRVVLAQGPDKTVQIDLNNGTVIKPEGLKLAPGEKIAALGDYSKGVFVAKRVLLAPTQSADAETARGTEATVVAPTADGGAVVYSTWQPAWDAGSYDRDHILIGTVASYDNARLVLAQGPEKTVKVDLKQGTVIKPEGLKLAPGEKVAVIGSYSKGTFIADRVVLHDAR